MRKSIIRVLCCVLCIALCLTVAAPRAHAVSGLVIVGTLALTMGLVVAITLISADSAGMKDAFETASSYMGVSVSDACEQALKNYWSMRAMPLIHLYDLFQRGTRVVEDGRILLDSSVCDFLTGFFNWVWSEDGMNLQQFDVLEADAIEPPSSNPVVDCSDLPNLVLASLPVQYSYLDRYDIPHNISISVLNGDPLCCAYNINSSGVTLCFASDFPFSLSYSDNGSESSISSFHGGYNGYYRYYREFTGNGIGNAASQNFVINYASGVSNPVNFKVQYTLINGAVVPGESNVDTNVLEIPDNDDTDVRILDIPNSISLPAPVSGVASADSYLGAVSDAIYSGTGILDYTDANDVAGSAVLSMDSAVDVLQGYTSADEWIDSPSIAETIGSPTMDNFSIDLRDYFPFCIPFDIYDMLNLLSGSRAAPYITWNFYVPTFSGSMQEYSLNLDFSVLDSAAAVLRTMELLAFGLGLALATKKLLMGS